MKLLALLFTISLLTACQGKPSHDFAIKGTIKNYNKSISLFEINTLDGNVKFVQKIQPNTTGAFTFNVKTNEEKLYLLASEEEKREFLGFINDTSTIIVDIDEKSNNPYLAKNSTASKELIDFFIFKNQKIQQINDTIIKLQSSNLFKDSTLFVNTINESKTHFVDELLLYYKKINHPIVQAYTLFNILLLNTNNHKMDEINTLIQEALKQYPENKYLKEIKQKLETNYFTQKNQYKIPSFSLPNAQGKTVSIDEFKGKYFLLDFWASWCIYCRQESPYLVKAYNKFKDKNFTIVSVSLDEDKDAWLNAIYKDKFTWTQLNEAKGYEGEIAQLFNINALPTNFLIDPQGNIIDSNLRGDALEEKLNEILK